ncbi:inner centromere protein isoform X2 [Kogia breviceps]|uniref:inner centromere protein isoform X2 n=1 Tax=Kogia breviceps TaxID=27615 RepID=UPI0034D2F978
MGTTAPGPIHLLELCEQKLMEFVCNVDNKDMVWLEEIEEEAERMFTREFSKEPELMPKTPSQKNRRKKRRISYVQDENRDPIRRSRLSRRKTRSSRQSSRHLRSKDKGERLATVVGEDGSVLRRVTRAAAAAAATSAAATPSPTPESPTVPTKKPEESLAPCQLVPVVEIGIRERRSAEQHLSQVQSAQAPPPTPAPATALASQITLTSEEDSTPQKPEAGRLESVTVSSLITTPQDPKGRGVGAGRSASKLRIAATSPGPQDSPSSPASPWRQRVLAPILPDNFSTPTGSRVDRRSVRRSLIAPSSPGPQVSLAQNYSLVSKEESTVRRSSRRVARKATKEPAASARIICHSYLERLLNVEVPQKVSPTAEEPSKEAEPEETAEPEVPKNSGSALRLHSATQIAISTPGSQPAAGGHGMPAEGRQEAQTVQADGPKEPPQSVRRKRSYKQAVSELDEGQQLGDEELQPPRSKTPSPPCPASKVVRPLRAFLHTVQRNQTLMTPTSTPHSSGMKSFMKRNTPLRVDPKEKERQRLENLRRKEEAEQLRRQKVEEDKRRRLEEVKLKREERLRKVLQARERVEQMKEEKKKQIEQKFAQIDEKTEKAKEERLAEEKAKKKAAAKKMEEVEARRRQEEEARRLRWLQQEEEEKRSQELLQKRKEEEQERLRRAAEAKRLAEQREQGRLQAERELQEREKALRLQKERLLRELEEKKKKSPACTSYQMTPQGHRAPPKINPDNYGMDLNSDDSTDDEAHPRKPIPNWARGTQLSQAIIHQYYHPPNLLELFGTILPLDLEDIFKKSKPRYHKRTSSAVWNSPPLQGTRVPGSLVYSLKKH